MMATEQSISPKVDLALTSPKFGGWRGQVSGGGSVRRKEGWVSGVVHGEFTCQSAEMPLHSATDGGLEVKFIAEAY